MAGQLGLFQAWILTMFLFLQLSVYLIMSKRLEHKDGDSIQAPLQSLCVQCCVDVFKKKPQSSVSKNGYMSQHHSGLLANSHRIPLANSSDKNKPVQLLKALFGYKRKAIQAVYLSPLLVIITRVTLIDSRKFPLHRFPLIPPNSPNSSYLLTYNFFSLQDVLG